MNDSERRLIESECRDLVVALCQLSDHGEKEKAVQCFTPDGTWIRGGKPFTGRAEMLQSFRGSPTQVIRHLTSNILITVKDDKSAEGVTYYLAFHTDPGTAPPKLPLPLEPPFSLGEWHDKFVRTPEGWRISHREVKRFFQHAGGH
jgi:SnoaL-like domain